MLHITSIRVSKDLFSELTTRKVVGYAMVPPKEDDNEFISRVKWSLVALVGPVQRGIARTVSCNIGGGTIHPDGTTQARVDFYVEDAESEPNILRLPMEVE